MNPVRYLRVRNFEKYQSFNFKNLKNDPKPPWIKLWFSLLGDEAFFELPDASKFHVIGMYLIASQHDNLFKANVNWLEKQMGADTKIDLDLLIQSRFIEWAEAPTLTATPTFTEIIEKAKKETDLVLSPLKDRESILGIEKQPLRGREEVDKEKEKPLANSSPEPKYSDEFQEFWKASSRRGSKVEAYAVWKRLRPNAELQCQIRAGMSAWQDSVQWQDETKQPHVHRWLKRRGWDEQVPRSPETTTSSTWDQVQAERERTFGKSQ